MESPHWFLSTCFVICFVLIVVWLIYIAFDYSTGDGDENKKEKS